MSQYYILKKEDLQEAKYQAQLLMLLPRMNPAILVEAAAIITVPDMLDCLAIALGGIPLASQIAPGIPMTVDIPASEKPPKKTKRRPATGTCSQCGNERELAKTGICKPCAMNNARAARKNGQELPPGHVGLPAKAINQSGNMQAGIQEIKINRAASAEPRIITRYGPIKGKKLG